MTSMMSFLAVFSLIYLNKMIAPAKCSHASLQPIRILQIWISAQLFQVKAFLYSIPDMHIRKNCMNCFIQLFEINCFVPQIDRIHTAANIHTDNIRNSLVSYCHRCSDCTAFPGVNIWHNADPAVVCNLIIAHSPNLTDCLILNYCRIANRRIHFSFYLKHLNSSINKACSTAMRFSSAN